jgi:hypothetical protein
MYSFSVHGEGNCFYDSLAAALNAQDYHARSIAERKVIGKSLREKIERFLKHEDREQGWARFWDRQGLSPQARASVPTYHEAMKQIENYHTWAEVHLICYALEKLRLNHVFIDSTNNQIYCGVVKFDEDRDLVIILWRDHQHFEPIGLKTTKQFLFSRTDPVTESIYRAWSASTCPRVSLNMVLGGGGGPFHYRFDPSVTAEERAVIRDILNDEAIRETHGHGHVYGEAVDPGEAVQVDPDVVLHMWPNARIVEAFEERFDGFSVCAYGQRPVQIYFNRDNWNHNTSHFSTLSDYRKYLVWHEMGHAHGREHIHASHGERCHVMTQQSAAANPTCTPSKF